MRGSNKRPFVLISYCFNTLHTSLLANVKFTRNVKRSGEQELLILIGRTKFTLYLLHNNGSVVIILTITSPPPLPSPLSDPPSKGLNDDQSLLLRVVA